MRTKRWPALALTLALVLCLGVACRQTPEPTVDLGDIGSRANSPRERICINCSDDSYMRHGGRLQFYSDNLATETLRLDGALGRLGVYSGGTETARLGGTDALQLYGDGTVWEDLRVPLERGKTAGSNVPTYEQWADDGNSSSGVYAYSFDDDDEIWLTVQMPHGWKTASTIYPHVHWMAEGDASTKNVGLGLEYIWSSIGETITTTTIVTRNVAGDTAYNHEITGLPASGIAGTGEGLSSILAVRLYREAAASDNYTGGIYILEFDVHYEIDALGSREITTK